MSLSHNYAYYTWSDMQLALQTLSQHLFVLLFFFKATTFFLILLAVKEYVT